MWPLYSQERYASTQFQGRARPRAQNLLSAHSLSLVNENDEVLHVSEATLIGMMSLAEQRGWRATALTRGDLTAFAAADASQCAVVLRAGLQDELSPVVAVGDTGSVTQVFLDVNRVRDFPVLSKRWFPYPVSEHLGDAPYFRSSPGERSMGRFRCSK